MHLTFAEIPTIRVSASRTLLTMGQFCDPPGHFKWYLDFPPRKVMKPLPQGRLGDWSTSHYWLQSTLKLNWRVFWVIPPMLSLSSDRWLQSRPAMDTEQINWYLKTLQSKVFSFLNTNVKKVQWYQSIRIVTNSTLKYVWIVGRQPRQSSFCQGLLRCAYPVRKVG